MSNLLITPPTLSLSIALENKGDGRLCRVWTAAISRAPWGEKGIRGKIISGSLPEGRVCLVDVQMKT